jgi:DNA-binding NtrC family response regulator
MKPNFATKNVLLVDDDPALITLLTEVLEAAGYFVESAGNGRKGLERQQARRWDVVISDRAMPEMSGEEMARRIKMRQPDLPIILITGCREAIRQPDQYDAILIKPFRFDALLTCVSNTIEGHHEENAG